MIMGLRRWERLGSTMTGGSANRLMGYARRAPLRPVVRHPRLLERR